MTRISTLVLAWLGLFVLSTFGCGGPAEPSTPEAPDSSRSRGDGVVRHPSGAVVRLPAGSGLRADSTSLDAIPVPATLAEVPLVSPVYCLVSEDDRVPEKPIELVLPGGAHDVVLAWSDLGGWIPLPSEVALLDGGVPGRRLRIDRQPLPWILTCARGPEREAPTESPARDGVGSELLEVERLRWTDKEAMHRRLAGRGVGAAAPHDPDVRTGPEVGDGIEPEEPRETLWAALRCFRRAGRHLRGRDVDAPAALADWRRGIDLLRAMPPGDPEPYHLGQDDWWPPYLPLSLDFRIVLHTTLSVYAPWGLELTGWMLDHGLLEGLDLRILRPYGELPWSDVVLSHDGPAAVLLGHGPWTHAAPETGRLRAESVTRRVVLRFVAPRVVDRTWRDRLADGARVTELTARWGGAAYGVAALATGGAGLVVGLAPLGFALLDTGLEHADDGSSDVCVTVGHASTTASYAWTGVVAYREAAKVGSAGLTARMARDAGVKLALVDAAAKIVQRACARDAYPQFLLRAAARCPTGYAVGSPRVHQGFEHDHVPPILVQELLCGRVRDGQVVPSRVGSGHALGALDYPVDEVRTRVWQLRHRGVYANSVQDPVQLPNDVPAFARLFEVVEHHGLVDYRLHRAPCEQFVAYAVPRAFLEKACVRQGLDPADWDRVDPELLGVRVEVLPAEQPGRAIAARLVDALEPPDAETRTFRVHLVAPACEPSPAERQRVFCAPLFQARHLQGTDRDARLHAVRLDGPPATRLALVLRGPEESELRFRADFGGELARRITASRRTTAGEEPLPWHVAAATPVVEAQDPLCLLGWQFPGLDGRLGLPEPVTSGPAWDRAGAQPQLCLFDPTHTASQAWLRAIAARAPQACQAEGVALMEASERGAWRTGPLRLFPKPYLLRVRCAGRTRFVYVAGSGNEKLPRRLGDLLFFGLPPGPASARWALATADGRTLAGTLRYVVEPGKETHGESRARLVDALATVQRWLDDARDPRAFERLGERVNDLWRRRLDALRRSPDCTATELLEAVGRALALQGAYVERGRAAGVGIPQLMGGYHEATRLAATCGDPAGRAVLERLVAPMRALGRPKASEAFVRRRLAELELTCGHFEASLRELDRSLALRDEADPRRRSRDADHAARPDPEVLARMVIALEAAADEAR